MMESTLALVNKINTYLIEQKDKDCTLLKEIQIKQLQNVAKGLIRIASENADPELVAKRQAEQKIKEKLRKERKARIKAMKKEERYKKKYGDNYVMKINK